MLNRTLLAAIVLAAVSSTAFALDVDQPARDRDAAMSMSSEKGLAQQASEWEAHEREIYHRGSSIS